MIVSFALAAALGVAAPGVVPESEAPVDAPVAAPAVAALPRDAKVAGRGYADLAEAWWRWAYRRRDGMRPYQDPTGAECRVGQAADVWFLAGTGGSGVVERQCTIPENTHVFFPVLVVLETSKPGERRDCATLRAAVDAEADRPIAARVELDGVALTPVRGGSRACFDAYADAEEDDPPPGMYAPAATDGLWILLPPLGKGEHRLVVEAKQASVGGAPGRYDQSFTYRLDVGGSPSDEETHEPSSEDEPERLRL